MAIRIESRAPNKLPRMLVAISGILGTVALVCYYSAPFWLMPLPAADAPAADVIAFGTQYHDVVLLDAWLQIVGSFLSVVFVLGLVDLAGAASRLAGRLTQLVGATVLSLALLEATFEIAAVEAGVSGHVQTSLVCFDLTNTFIHIFLVAPSLFLVLGLALNGSQLLPRGLNILALVLGVVFQVLGFVGLFNSTAVAVVIFILLAQEAWTVAAAITIVVRREKTWRIA